MQVVLISKNVPQSHKNPTQTLPAHNDTSKLRSPSCDLVPGLNKYIEDLENFEKDARL